MLESFLPSLIIAASTVVAFAVGRLLAWAFAPTRFLRVMRAIVIAFSLLLAIFFVWSHSSRYALLLPAGFVFGFLSYASGRIAPGLFDRDR